MFWVMVRKTDFNWQHVSFEFRQTCSCADDGTENVSLGGAGMKQLLWAEHMSVIIHGAEMEERNM